jgi:hypothetical protein
VDTAPYCGGDVGLLDHRFPLYYKAVPAVKPYCGEDVGLPDYTALELGFERRTWMEAILPVLAGALSFAIAFALVRSLAFFRKR